MANTLLVAPADCRCGAALEHAIAETRRKGGKLVIAAVIDPKRSEQLCESLSDSGLIGDRVSDNVSATLHRDYEHRAKALVDELGATARAAGIEVALLVEEGEASDVCGRLVRAHGIDLAILVAERRSWLAKLFSGGDVRTPALPGCEVRVVEEDA